MVRQAHVRTTYRDEVARSPRPHPAEGSSVLGSRTICACATVRALYAVAKVVARKETARWLANNISSKGIKE